MKHLPLLLALAGVAMLEVVLIDGAPWQAVLGANGTVLLFVAFMVAMWRAEM